MKLVISGTSLGQSIDMRAIDSDNNDTTIAIVKVWDAQGNYANSETVFVRKGMKLWTYVSSGVTAHAYYIQLNY
jgi:hypothetical protein